MPVSMWSKGNNSILLVGMKMCITTMDMIMEVSENDGNQIPHDPDISFLGI